MWSVIKHPFLNFFLIFTSILVLEIYVIKKANARATIEGLHVIAMDSHTPGSNTGSFSEEQLDWLAVELRDHQDEPAIIAFHEPIFFFGELGLFNKVDAKRFRDIVSEGNVLAVLN